MAPLLLLKLNLVIMLKLFVFKIHPVAHILLLHKEVLMQLKIIRETEIQLIDFFMILLRVVIIDPESLMFTD